jgi:hypothetical protein
MKALYCHLAASTDPEERLEDACMAKAMHDVYGAGITIVPPEAAIPEGGTAFGRARRIGLGPSTNGKASLDYATDPGFLWGITRRFHVCGLDEAERLVRDIHASGRDAFVKAMEEKLMVARVERGRTLHDALGDMIWSFIDKPDCLMVQEFVQMRNERRFVVFGGEIVAQSPVAWRRSIGEGRTSPRISKPIASPRRPARTRSMTRRWRGGWRSSPRPSPGSRSSATW